MDKYHLAEVIGSAPPDVQVKVNPVRMNRSQAELIADAYNRVAGPGDPRVCIVNCWDQPVCCVEEDADISQRDDVLVDVLGRGSEFTGAL